MIKYQLKIIEIVKEATGTNSYYFEKPAEFVWDEGAHVHIAHIGYDAGEAPNKAWVRHMSLSTLPSDNKVGITTRVPGSNSEFKQKLAELQVGDEIVLFKLGSRMSLKREGRPVVLLSMGVGIATMRPIISTYLNDTEQVPQLINANVDASGEFVFKEVLDAKLNESYRNYWLSNRASYYEVLNQVGELENAFYYIVGSDAFIKDSIQKLRTHLVKDEDIVLDKKEEVRVELLT